MFIPKPDGSQRPLGVPTVLDRVIQQALAQVLTPLFEDGFSRTATVSARVAAPTRRCAMEACWKEGRRHAVDCDLKSFFDTVNHDRLMGQLRDKIHDRRVLGLIRRYLQAGWCCPTAPARPRLKGCRRAPLSPLLANITLDPLDSRSEAETTALLGCPKGGEAINELERRGHRFARYADDFLVMVKSAKAAERVMASLTRFVEGRLKLVVNRAKSKSAPLKQCAFLGFQIGARGKAVWTARPCALQRRGNHPPQPRAPAQDVIDELRRYVVGWLNYFTSDTYSQVVELAEWVRLRVRLYYWKQWKRPDTPTPSAGWAYRARKCIWPRAAGRVLADECQQHRPTRLD